MTALGPDLERPRQGRVAAARAVGVEARRVDPADPGQEPQAGAPACGTDCADGTPAGRASGPVGRVRSAAVRPAASSRPTIPAASTGATAIARGRSPAIVNSAAGARSQRPRHGLRSQVAAPSAAGSRPARASRSRSAHSVLGAGQPAGDVVADVGHDRRPRRGREQGVERGDAVGLGRRDGQAPADVVERRLADPAEPGLDRVERRQQQVAARPRRVAARARTWPSRRASRGARRPRRRRPAVPRTASTAARSAGSPAGDDVEVHRPSVAASIVVGAVACAAQLLDPDRGGLELGGARLGVRGVDRQEVGRDLVLEVERHERQARAAATRRSGPAPRPGRGARRPGPRSPSRQPERGRRPRARCRGSRRAAAASA